MGRMISMEVREPERLIEEPEYEHYDLVPEEPHGGMMLYNEERSELLDGQPVRRRLERREAERVLEDTEKRQLPEAERREEVREIPQPRQVATKTPTASVIKLKAGERIVKTWSRPVWFMRMSDVKNVAGQDVHLTRMRSGVYAFRAVDDETFEGLCRIVGKKMPSESDTFGPLKIKSKGKKSRGSWAV